MGAVLGVSCDYHDAAAALVVDGVLVAAAEEERFSRRKHDADLPERAMAWALHHAGVAPDDLEAVVFYEKPLSVVDRWLATRRRIGPRSLPTFVRDAPSLLTRQVMVGYRLERALTRLGAARPVPVRFAEHHLSHAAAAFLPSPFERAAILTVDGVGEWATASIGRGWGSDVELLEEVRFPDSLGLAYSLITAWCGFRPNDGEYKVMGLAPFGEPRHRAAIEDLLGIDGRPGLAVDARRVGWWSRRAPRRLVEAFGGPPRTPGAPLGRREADLAASMQVVTEAAVLRLAERAVELTGDRDLVMAGGVALNCVANGKLRDSGVVDRMWIQPAAGDAGSAVGAALWFAQTVSGAPRPAGDAMRGAALGPSFGDDEIGRWLDESGIAHRTLDDTEVATVVADRLADGAIVGWFQGPMEFGPRALGHRSILADPRSSTVHRELNLRVKGREGFRPFAPVVLPERAAEWFEGPPDSPYMLFTSGVVADRRRPVDEEPDADFVTRAAAPRSEIPACTHVDGSARVQTVTREHHPALARLLDAFEDRTGCPVLLNTSFNVADEPIVCTPDDAVGTARAAGLDLLVLGRHLVERAALA